MTSYLRPDEQAAYSEVDRAQRRDRRAGSALKTAGTAALAVGLPAVGAASKLGSRILPLLNEYVPAELALKGINKISPRLGSFLNKGLQQGLDLQDGLDFIKDSYEGAQDKSKPAKQSLNIIQKHSPELFDYIKTEMGKGRTAIEAGALAQMQDKFKKHIKKLTEEHKTPWSSLLESVFGQGNNPKQEAVKKYNQHKQSMQDQLMEQVQQSPAAQQQNQPQQGQGQAALMAILQKLQQSRGGQ